MYQLPTEAKQWIQKNNSDRFGTVHVSKNLDFDREGYLRLSKRPRSLYDSSLDADFTVVTSICYDTTTQRYYVLTDGKIFYLDKTLLTVTEDATSNVPTNLGSGSDMLPFNGNLYVSAGVTDGLRRWTGSAWSASSLYALTSDTSPMAVFENKVSLAIGQDNTVILIDTSHTLVETLTIPNDYRVTSMDWASNRLYIGTRHIRDGQALLFEWDGGDSSANNAFPCGSVRIDSVKAYQGTVVIMTGEGQLLAFNGGGFTELANLPVYYTNLKYSYPGNNVGGNVAHRGMVVVGDQIMINLVATIQTSGDNQRQPRFLNNFPGGVWCYDPKVGLYHRHTVSADLRLKTSAVTTGNVNTTTDIITVAGATVPATGTPVIYDDGSDGVGTNITELVHRQKYYTINVSGTTMKLATSYANAIAGTAIDLTGTGNNSQFFIFFPNRDYGGDRVSQASAIAPVVSEAPIRSDGISLLYGGVISKTSASSTVYVLNTIVDTQENRGSIITPRLDATLISDAFQNITVKYQNILTVEDKIIIKYRIYERNDKLKFLDFRRSQTATITGANTFTSTATSLADAKIGDEVTFHAGTGMGYTAHITNITENAGTYTVTLDESLQNYTVSDTALFTVDNWQKIGATEAESQISIDDCGTFETTNGDIITTTGGAKTFPLAQQAWWMQLKIELRGEDVTIEDVLINNRPMKEFIA